MLLFYLMPQILYNGHRGLDAQIPHNQGLFDFLIKIVVNGRKPAENRVNARYNVVSCLGKAFYQTAEKSFCHTHTP